SETSSLMGLLDKFLRSDIAAQVAEGAFAPECTAHVEGMYTTYVDATKNTAEMTTCKEYFRALASYAWIQRDGMKELAAIYNSTLPVFLNDFLFSENKVIGLNLKGRSFGVEHNFGCDKSPITYFLTAIYLTSKDDEHLSALDVAAMKGLFGEQYGKLATVECEKTFWLGEVKYDRSNNTFSDDYKMKDNSNIGKQILLTMNPLACAGDVSCVRHIMGEHRENESNAKGQKQRVIKFLRGE
ncbi:MAG: hypothetical protein SGJ18_10250, partial [Pseudomonadota bacterium]|nr:hypothetical protein [Pseudomonadota bacterium]